MFKGMSQKDQNLWKGVMYIVALWALPMAFMKMVELEIIPYDILDIAYVGYLLLLVGLSIGFLMYTKPVNPSQFLIRRRQFVKWLLALVGFAFGGLIALLLVEPIAPVEMFERLILVWLIALAGIFFMTMIWYMLTLYNRNPAAVFFPNPIFVIQKQDTKKKSHSKKRMQKKLGR